MKNIFLFRTAAAAASTICMACVLFSCSYKTGRQLQNQENYSKYRTGFPAANISAELSTVLLSVKKITNYSSYRTYIFEDNARITIKDLNSEGILSHTRAGIVTNEATAGTALVMIADGKNIALLTCAHAVKAPDTIIQWNEYRDLDNNRSIQSISIKTKQQLYVRDMPEGSKFKVLASDPNHDIAIIGSDCKMEAGIIPVFAYPCGNSAELDWGSFIYLAGYPTGQQMVSHGIVSTLPEKAGSFYTDALFNEGMSGGLALAVTETGGTFELVGLARSVAGSFSYMLKPEKGNHEFAYNPAIPYSGNVYVDEKKDINYGVTSVISINQVKLFYNDHRNSLQQAGYNLDEFFGLNMKKK